MEFSVESALGGLFQFLPNRMAKPPRPPVKFTASGSVIWSHVCCRSSKLKVTEVRAFPSKLPLDPVVCCTYNKFRIMGNGASNFSSPLRCSVSEELQRSNCEVGEALLKRGLIFAATFYGVLTVGCQGAFSLERVNVFERYWSCLRGPGLHILPAPTSHALVLVSFLVLSAILSMAETTIITLWPWKVRELALQEKEDGVFRMLHADANRFMTTIIIGKTVFSIGATAIVTRAARKVLGNAGVGIAASIMIVIVLLLTEITPKCIAVNYAEEVARFVVTPVAWLSLIFYPIGRFANFISLRMLKMLGLNGKREPEDSKEELELKVQRIELGEKIKEQEKDMIKNVLEMKGTIVKEVMTPLKKVVAIESGAKLIDFKQLWIAHKCSRIPVYESLVDNIVGIAYVKDLVKLRS